METNRESRKSVTKSRRVKQKSQTKRMKKNFMKTAVAAVCGAAAGRNSCFLFYK